MRQDRRGYEGDRGRQTQAEHAGHSCRFGGAGRKSPQHHNEVSSKITYRPQKLLRPSSLSPFSECSRHSNFFLESSLGPCFLLHAPEECAAVRSRESHGHDSCCVYWYTNISILSDFPFRAGGTGREAAWEADSGRVSRGVYT